MPNAPVRTQVYELTQLVGKQHTDSALFWYNDIDILLLRFSPLASAKSTAAIMPQRVL